MPFYDDKRKALKMIDDLFSAGVDINIIKFKVGTIFGFSEKMVENRVNLIENIAENEQKYKKKGKKSGK